MPVIDIKGLQFGRLHVQSRAPNNSRGDAMWNCVCDCGKHLVVVGSALRSGHTKSCGCYHKEISSKIVLARGGFDKPLTKDEWRLSRILHNMKQRCYNPNNTEYEHYGGRGITICKEWHDVRQFIKWAFTTNYSDGLTIDRIDNDKGYSPDNCRFITRAEQNRNTSRTCAIIDDNGELLTARQAAQILGISNTTAAKWYREERLRTMTQFRHRMECINKSNILRTRKARGFA